MSSFMRKTFPVPPLSCNCSIVGDLETKQAVVVDPGGSPERILEEVASLDLTVCAILHTHAQFDHFLASGHIKLATGAPLCLHPNDKDLWNMLEIQCQMFGVPYVPVPSPDQWIEDEEEMVIGPYTATVLHTPGHTPGSACFYFQSEDLVFSGDTLFRGGIGRTDLWGGDGRAIVQSIRDRLFSLKEETLVIPGHGGESSIGRERESNVFVNA